MAGTPLSFLFSLSGLIMGKERKSAVIGLLMSGVMVVLFFGIPIILRCLR